MNSIAVTGIDGKKVNVVIDNCGGATVNEHALHTAFLLERDVPVRLSVVSGGSQLSLNIQEVKKGPRKGQFHFTLPRHWKNVEYLLFWDENRRSRPSSSMEVQIGSVRPASSQSDRSSPARPLSPWPEFTVQYLLETDPGKCCVTVMARRAAITCSHCLSSEQKDSGTVKVKPCRGNPMETFQNGQTSTVLKIAYIDKFDFVLLISEIPLCQEQPPFIDDAPFGETYILLGLSGQKREYQKAGSSTSSFVFVNAPLSVKKGIVSSKRLDKYNKHSGDSGMNKGDSGGGLFSMCGHLIGMAVEFDIERKNGISLMHFLPMTYLLPVFQSKGYPLQMLNSFEEGYPQEEEFSLPEDREIGTSSVWQQLSTKFHFEEQQREEAVVEEDNDHVVAAAAAYLALLEANKVAAGGISGRRLNDNGRPLTPVEDEQQSDDDADNSSETSAPPEWADQGIDEFKTDGLDADFFALADQSAEFFEQISNGDSSSTSLQSTKDVLVLSEEEDSFKSTNRTLDQMGGPKKDVIARKNKTQEAEDARIQHIIDTLTQEYREKLTKVLTMNSARNPMLDIHQLLDDLNLSSTTFDIDMALLPSSANSPTAEIELTKATSFAAGNNDNRPKVDGAHRRELVATTACSNRKSANRQGENSAHGFGSAAMMKRDRNLSLGHLTNGTVGRHK